METRKLKTMINVILLIIYVCLTVLGLLLVRVGGEQQFALSERVISLEFNILTLLGFLSYAVSFVLFMIIIPRFNLSYITPITTGSVFVLTILVSWLILRERIDMYQWFGIGAILSGIILMNIRRS